MTNKICIFILFFFGLTVRCAAQIEEGRYEFWREGVQLTYDMFQADTAGMSHYNKEYNIKSVISTGLWDVLDVPKKKRDWKTKPEKPYFCAAMDKTESFLLEKNDMSLNHAKLLWDICELSTRVARKSLASIVHQMDSLNGFHSTGVISLFYMTALNDGREFGKGLTGAFMHDVVIPKNDSLYYEYRKKIDKLLDETKEFATTEEEIRRFMTNIPLQGYIMAPQLLGDRKNRGKIEY
ncbi:MAG: hypothetical protein J6T60_04625 [Bacteroidales bacterium]|nr:hypothetical protein [Bacteroidales bacterium]